MSEKRTKIKWYNTQTGEKGKGYIVPHPQGSLATFKSEDGIVIQTAERYLAYNKNGEELSLGIIIIELIKSGILAQLFALIAGLFEKQPNG